VYFRYYWGTVTIFDRGVVMVEITLMSFQE